ncbi:MAG: TraR/DksA family transcriptional regulator [Acidobacteria bacterium]|nr:TraR/DksA family transcriptional regulator [Acidobacteriota bacterium]
MDNAKLHYFKDMLLQKRNALMSIVQRTEDYGREKDQNTPDITDMAVESYTREFLFGKSAGDRRILQDVEAALSRIDGRIYGVCANCDNEINPKRLEAVPWATMCVKCQELLEKGRLF